MASVLNFAKHLLKYKPQNNAARLALYHYLKNFCEPTEEIGQKVFRRFLLRCLHFAHWREHREELQQEVRIAISDFEKQESIYLGIEDFDWSEWQLLRIENDRDKHAVLKRQFSIPTAQLKCISDSIHSLVSLQLHHDGHLDVSTHQNIFYIKNGEIFNISEDLKLHYDHRLELVKNQTHVLQLGPHHLVQLKLSYDGFNAKIYRGYTFQFVEEIRGDKLNDFPKLFYNIKRLESHFIDRQSDPLYKELTQLLEKSIELMHIEDPKAQKLAVTAFTRGQNAIQNIFPDDKLLQILLKELAKSLQKLQPASHSAEVSPVRGPGKFELDL